MGAVADAGLSDDVAALAGGDGLREGGGGEEGFGLLAGLFVSFGDMDVSGQEGLGHGGVVAGLSPQVAPGVELVGDHGIHVDVLGDVEVVPRRVLEAGRAVAAEPDWRVRLLVRIR